VDSVAEPFTIAISDDAIADLRARLARTRWPREITDGGWTYGTNLSHLQELCEYWAEGFDWRAQEAALNRHPHFMEVVDGFRLHFIHAEGRGPAPLPLVLTHGWPSTIYELDRVIGPLSNPAAHGGDPADAFHVVVPSLPGYGFSEIPTVPGYGPARTAQLWDGLMSQLGYERYGAHGGDWGALVTAQLGWRYPERVAGVHRNIGGIQFASIEGQSEEARRARRELWQTEETGYQRIQGTKPQTLAYGLTDSPAGLAGWIVEKWRSWSDCAGDIESRFTKDELLTTVAIYWFTETIHSSTRFYYESAHDEENRIGGHIDAPSGFAVFSGMGGSRERTAEDCNLVHWSEFDRGGHFAAFEEPDLVVEDLRTFFRPLRT
jgi:pimeloyl-ACP methyl ester carboxylesterase